VLEAYGIEPPDGDFLAEMVARLIQPAENV
jgi:hypothetical protein